MAKPLRETLVTSTGESIQIETNRIGAPAPLPCHSETPGFGLPASDPFERAWWSHLHDRVNAIIAECGVDVQGLSNAYYPLPDEQDPLHDRRIVVSVMGEGNDEDRCLVCVDKVRQLFKNYAFEHVAFEVVNCNHDDWEFTCAIHEGESIVDAWKRSIRTAVLSAILPLSWHCVSVFRKINLDHNENEKDNRIVIGITLDIESRGRTWKDVEEEIIRACEKEELDDRIKVEFVYSNTWPCFEDPVRTVVPWAKNEHDAAETRMMPRTGPSEFSRLEPEHYECAPGMGSSLGPERLDPRKRGHGGTLGGYVELFDGETSQGVFGLTSWHVARAGLGPAASSFDINGIKPPDPNKADLKLFQPAQRDHDETLQIWKKMALEKVTFADMTEGESREHYLEECKDFLERRQNADEMYKVLKEGYFGHVYAASGFGRHEETNTRTDWALIRVNGEGREVGQNMLPEREGSRSCIIAHQTPSKGRMTRIGDATEAKAQARVFKISKMSGMRCGEYSFIDTEVNTPILGTTSERTYYGHGGDSTAFSRRGEVGALVVDERGQWIGMVTGGCPSNTEDSCFVTDARVIREDIKRVTGFEVRLPGGNEDKKE